MSRPSKSCGATGGGGYMARPGYHLCAVTGSRPGPWPGSLGAAPVWARGERPEGTRLVRGAAARGLCAPITVTGPVRARKCAHMPPNLCALVNARTCCKRAYARISPYSMCAHLWARTGSVTHTRMPRYAYTPALIEAHLVIRRCLTGLPQSSAHRSCSWVGAAPGWALLSGSLVAAQDLAQLQL